ncbi:hypothetical protein TNCT_653011 [Trichonephila clavata]|uniref:Uncharacterized protein n=1 Tax=Trichonephila clavata TaxID=2740835 RepID=A0A8X6FZ91_TRICU|nr:hypothetical protein TNCT_653011 [Trichonephila clavata]
MNKTVCDMTGHTPAFLKFCTELRIVDDVGEDFKAFVKNNFVSGVILYLKLVATITKDIGERLEMKKNQRKQQYDKRRQREFYFPVWFGLHPISHANNIQNKMTSNAKS